MSFAVTTGIPALFTIGDAASFQVSDADHPPADWTAIIYFKDEAGAIKNFARDSVSGAYHVFVLTNAQTATLVAGQNLVCLGFNDGTHRQTSDWQETLILADPTAAATPSFAQAQVTLLRSLVATLNTTGATSVNFNGQSFTRANVSELQNQLTQWEARLYNEKEQDKANRGLPTVGNRIPCKFV